MCGLSGIIITKPKLISLDLAKGIFSLLMLENDSRGGHSWGAWGTNTDPVRALGRYVANTDMFHQKFADYECVEDGPSFIFGHTRYGTHGDKTVENAHPFEHGTLFLAHNGVVNVDGYDNTDHAVDSGRIAKAIVEHGWKDGMAKVSGSCALLTSVQNQPLVYRHNQILHYAQFDWGIAISSTKLDLELVLLKKLGLHPTKLEQIEEDVFYQPGFGEVYEEAPAKKMAAVSNPNAWRGHSCGWDDWEEDYGTRYYEGFHNGRKIQGFARGQHIPQTTPLIEEEKKEAVVSATIKAADKMGLVKRTIRPKVSDIPAEVKAEEAGDWVDTCEYCGMDDVSIHDLFHCNTVWSGGEPILMCMDCIMDEISSSGRMEICGPYGEVLTSGVIDLENEE